jgi:ATP-dependent exoDNAse (exonuclease V) beta subunit
MTGHVHFISAGAGSGKTFRLTQLLHEKLAAGSIRPAGVIATTFTKKAATELRERVRSHLLKQGAHRLANAMGQARIGTVNSVCGGLLERFAFEAGFATEQQVLEESQAILLVKQAIDSVLNGPQAGALWTLANRLGIEDWRDELRSLINQARANDIEPSALAAFGAENAADLLSHFPKATVDDLTQSLLATIAAVLPDLAKVAETGGKKNTNDYLTLVRDAERGLKASSLSWGDWVKLSKALPEKAAHPLAEPINALAARMAEHPQLHADITAYLAQMFALCAEALAFYAERKREMGAVDFTDQEHLLLKVLEVPSVASTLTEELDLLLVDEFQDTSPIQLALFLKLAQFARETIWVGDIKQAIYGFRGSDTALMEAVLQAVRGWGNEPEILGFSWRSRPALVRLVNEVFTGAFANSLQPTEILLQPKRPEVLDGPVFGNWLLAGKNKQQEMAALAMGVQQLLDSGYNVLDIATQTIRRVRLSDIAILCRLNDNVSDIASSLRAAGIPSATAQPGLLDTPEAILAMACLRRLNDPSDTVASAEIIALSDGAEPETWLLDRLQHLEAGGDRDAWREVGDDAHPMLATLAKMRAELPLLAPREALQQVINRCNLPSRVLRWKQDAAVARTRLANLEALLELAAQYEDICRSAQHAASISGLILWLGETADAEQDALAQPAIDAVKVMTHHAAKGLEWPVVILTDLSANLKDRLWGISAASRGEIDVDAPLNDRFIRYWPWPFGKQGKVPVADEIALTEEATRFRAAAVEESKRLLYVSMTRARDLLILARSQRKPTGEWLDTLGAPWLMPAAPDSPTQLPSGEKLDSQHLELDSAEAAFPLTPAAQTLYWFETAVTHSDRLPLAFNPSAAAPESCNIAEQHRISERIPLSGGVDMAMLGTAIHACIAAALTDLKAPLFEDEVDEILAGHGVDDVVTAKSVLEQINALDNWMTQRWPEARRFAEIPVEAILHNGQVMQGRIDLLLEIPDGWILLDHKSNPQGPEKWEAIARDYSGQLAAYGNAVAQATGKPVIESWLFFPVSGGAVKIELG